MKKLIMMLCLCLGVCMPGFSQYIDENVYRGNMSFNQVLKTIDKGFLPIYINDVRSFTDGSKREAAEAAIRRIKQEKNTYRTYYNAAVVYATKAVFEGLDNYYPLKENIAKQAIAYATKAIEINAVDAKKKRIAESPYMYLLRGEVRYEQSIFPNVATGKYTIRNKTMAQAALKDLQKVAKLQPNIAPYDTMYVLASVLGQKDLATQYIQLKKTYDQVNARKLAEAKAAKREVQAKQRSQSNSGKGVNLSIAGVSTHWKF